MNCILEVLYFRDACIVRRLIVYSMETYATLSGPPDQYIRHTREQLCFLVIHISHYNTCLFARCLDTSTISLLSIAPCYATTYNQTYNCIIHIIFIPLFHSHYIVLLCLLKNICYMLFLSYVRMMIYNYAILNVCCHIGDIL